MAVAGGCMGGAVRYEASGEPTAVIHCHCQSCRRHAGALVVTHERIEWFDVADDLPRHHEWDEGKPYQHGPARSA